jgi:phage replication O-like protein O
MASPQKENGYTSLSNEIIEAIIRTPFSGQELRISLLILRKTYGFNKKADYISLSQIAKALGISVVRASQVVNKLQNRHILTLKENLKGRTKKYSFNKNYEEWKTL